MAAVAVNAPLGSSVANSAPPLSHNVTGEVKVVSTLPKLSVASTSTLNCVPACVLPGDVEKRNWLAVMLKAELKAFMLPLVADSL